jgi:hypothetical protein
MVYLHKKGYGVTMLEKIQCFLEQEHTPLEKALLIIVSLLSGLIIGMIFSPIKNGMKICSDNGNGNGNNNNGNEIPDKKKAKGL